MKSFYIILVTVITFIVSLFLAVNLFLFNMNKPKSREYRVQIERAAADIEKSGFESINTEKYPLISNIELSSENNNDFFLGGNSDYLIREINGRLYRFDYDNDNTIYRNQVVIVVNIALAVMMVASVTLLIYIRLRLLKPFNNLKEMPYELSKGNLTVPLKENKSRFFGRFIWGMDLLREKLEQQKEEELKLQKEKKTLILSLSHDIKTPLSAIKLYSKALSRNIYSDSEKNHEIAENINAKADEIEGFVSQIIKASGEDFLNLTVSNSEFYLSGIINKINDYYSEKLAVFKTDFKIANYTDCIIKGDPDRAIEVLQNLIENAIKYGDGNFINISFSDEEDCRLVQVSNSGCTLSENEMPHIFDSFWRGSNTGNKSGSGLGLYICRQLMNKMSGEIFADIKSINDEDKIIKITAVFRKA